MRLTTVRLPQKLHDELNVLVRKEIFPNRSEAVRTAVRDLIRKELHVYCPHCNQKVEGGN